VSDPIPSPVAWYAARSAEAGFLPDSAQQNAIQRLQRLYEELIEFKAYRNALLIKKLGRRPPPHGIYMHGAVGRGKSLLMDAFYASIPYRRKRRVHFHDFMREVHEALRDHKGEAEPLKAVAADICRRTRLLCFDEFHVNDIADAMILARLLEELFRGGLVCVMTSNYPPDELYRNGLQRDRFLPAIELIKRNLEMVRVDAGTDYRLRALRRAPSYLEPLSAAADEELGRIYRSVCREDLGPGSVAVNGREIRALRVGAEAVWFGFDELCGGPRSQNDYLEVARRFRTVCLSGVPRMTAAHASEARRFTWLVDILYDRRVKLMLTADAPPESLYVEGVRSDEFHRTASRLREMQSVDYLGAELRPGPLDASDAA
jgi:cell division protein ZapE